MKWVTSLTAAREGRVEDQDGMREEGGERGRAERGWDRGVAERGVDGRRREEAEPRLVGEDGEGVDRWRWSNRGGEGEAARLARPHRSGVQVFESNRPAAPKFEPEPVRSTG
ncbi:hypothetical protein NL676_008885 [Syzygium grande]|nr:hypothetical protein NL676_008885 [Syzygium grande]